jgi:glycerophosphoryl diester phosphodiesterase
MRYGFAHRGGSHGPDNALTTFADALARGATGLETDAWLSLDGKVVLDHDGVAGPPGRQPIADVRRDELPAHMATLDELYTKCGTDFALAIDVKTASVATAIVDTAERHAAAANLWIVAPAAAHLEALDLGAAHTAVTVRGNVMRSSRRRHVLELARGAGVHAINARWMWWDRHIVDEVHALGMLAFGYDAQRRLSLDRSLAIGLDGVFSDHVDRMLAALRRASPAM